MGLEPIRQRHTPLKRACLPFQHTHIYQTHHERRYFSNGCRTKAALFMMGCDNEGHHGRSSVIDNYWLFILFWNMTMLSSHGATLNLGSIDLLLPVVSKIPHVFSFSWWPLANSTETHPPVCRSVACTQHGEYVFIINKVARCEIHTLPHYDVSYSSYL